MYEFHSRHDLEKVHVLQIFSTAPLLMIRMKKFFHQTTQRHLFTPEKCSNHHSETIHWLRKFELRRTLLRHSKSSHSRFNGFIVIPWVYGRALMHSFKSQINSNKIINIVFCHFRNSLVLNCDENEGCRIVHQSLVNTINQHSKSWDDLEWRSWVRLKSNIFEKSNLV
jgi:hypothetical protein